MLPGELQFLTINDFTPGIRQRTFGGGESSRSPVGAADPSATFRCRVLPDGALGPMPALAATKTYAADGDPEDGEFRITGFHVTGPMQDTPSESDFSGVDNVEIHIALEYYEAGDVHKWDWLRFQVWDAVAVDTIKAFTVDENGFTPTHWYRPTSFIDARMHATDPAALGDIFVVAGWHPDNMSAVENVWAIFPDPATPNTNGTADIYTLNEVTLMVQHQGRVVSIDNHVFQHGGSGYWIINDQLIWTQVNLPIPLDEDGDTIPESVGVFTQGPVSGYGAVISASAQELLLVKHRGGATIISGDLDDPTVMSLPGVASTRGATTMAIYTPVGVVYGVKDGGIHAWGGGDTSNKLSLYLEDDFWQMRPDDWQAFDGKFDLAANLLLCPNNWVYDMETQSWWRIEDPATYQIFQWSVSPQSDMFYGAPATVDANGPIWYRFNPSVVADSYVWKSQYITQTIDHRMEVREINIRALAAGEGVESTITVTLSNEDGETISEEFEVTNYTLPKLLRRQTQFQGTGIKVAVEATSLDGEPAPIIYEISLGHQMAQSVEYV